jgi:hypothetical protein
VELAAIEAPTRCMTAAYAGCLLRILCKTSENLVGYLYQWNNGDVQPAWFDGAMADVRYEPFIPAPEQNPVDPKIPRPRQQDLTHLEKA